MANLPIKSHSVSKPFIQISVQYIVWNICNCPFHPFDEDLSLTSVKVKLHKFVFAWRDFPEEFFCNLAPENSWFVDGMVIHFLVSIHTGHMRLRFDLFRWVKPSHQLLFVLISVCWNYVVHDGVEILPLWEMDTNLLNGEGVRQFLCCFFFPARMNTQTRSSTRENFTSIWVCGFWWISDLQTCVESCQTSLDRTFVNFNRDLARAHRNVPECMTCKHASHAPRSKVSLGRL